MYISFILYLCTHEREMVSKNILKVGFGITVYCHIINWADYWKKTCNLTWIIKDGLKYMRWQCCLRLVDRVNRHSHDRVPRCWIFMHVYRTYMNSLYVYIDVYRGLASEYILYTDNYIYSPEQSLYIDICLSSVSNSIFFFQFYIFRIYNYICIYIYYNCLIVSWCLYIYIYMHICIYVFPLWVKTNKQSDNL